ncbi:hypothetical protein HF295_07650 [Hujiaoplasma nucleasis]|uniref:Uncharacterized protein n=1 Tax=Hujiaoplasma nucleasis TaxID=2725268 RepID=A0A7L6N391_9MOLU|nr:hypothetical protein [Hujiaoplasma nucleasis]QLY40730.1 hypothetical protein HF295_07650 [Hujiaoplasma nucleasis]
MYNYKKTCLITDQDIHLFYNEEKNKIMSSINEVKSENLYIFPFIKYAWMPVLLIIVSLSLILFIKPITGDDDRQIFKNNFHLVSQKLSDIVDHASINDLSKHRTNQMKELSYSKFIDRQSLLDAYLKGETNIVYDDYLEQLLTTKDFIEDIEDIVLNSSNWQLDEDIIPDENIDVSFRFLLSSDDYIVIKKRSGQEYSTIKLGIESNQLIYYDIHYSYDFSSDFINNEASLNFNYFHFIEDDQAVYINSLTDLFTLRYTSIIDGSQFTISRGNQVVEGLESSDGYSFYSYDSEALVTRYFQVVDEVIVSETFDVYSNHGLLYRYEDLDYSSDLTYLYVNIVPALGWDYLCIEDTDDQLEGVYLEDGSPLFTGHIYYTYTPKYGYAAFKQTIEKNDFSDDHFKLTEYGMNLSEEKASIEYLDSIRISNFEQAKEDFFVEGIDFFTEDLKSELYNYIDKDLLIEFNAESNSGEDIVTGDVEAFENEIFDFEQAFSLKGHLVMESDVTIAVYDGDHLIQSQVNSQHTKYDILDMYLERRTFSGQLFGTQEIIMAYEGQLVSFTNDDGPVTDFEIVSQSASPQIFMEYLMTEYPELDLLDGVNHIESQGQGVYKVTLNDDFFGDEINMDLVFNQMGIDGFSEAMIEAIYTFNQNHQSYDVVLTITGLKTIEGAYDVTYIETTNVSIESFIKKNPLESLIFFRLPQTRDGIIFDSNINQLNVYYINEGESWMRLYLEEGVYSSSIYGSSNSNLSYVLIDENGQIIDDSNYRFEIGASGYYYYKFNSSVKQRIDTRISENPYPKNQDITMDQSNDLIELYSQLETDTYNLFTNIDDKERVLRLTLNPINQDFLVINELDALGDYINDYFFENYVNVVYILIPENTRVDFEISGMYQGQFSFAYDYLYPPVSEESDVRYEVDNLDDFPHAIMNEYVTKVRYDFSIEEEGYYKLDKNMITFGLYLDLKMALYDSEGTRLRISDHAIYETLQAGNYYIEFYFIEADSGLLILMPTVNR